MTDTPRQSGMTLIELMVALAIGSFLMIGAMTVFMQSRTTFRITESVSRLQETARFALDAIEPDIRMAQYWGLTTRGSAIVGSALSTAPPGMGPATCGNNWTINLLQAVQGSNNGYTWACAGTAPVETNSDTLIVRHVTDDIVVPAAGRLTIATLRNSGVILNTAAAPSATDYPPTRTQIHALVVNGYYVRRATATTQPALRRKFLQANGTIADEEVIAGVEDMQVQFGIDTDVAGTSNRGSIDRYINTNNPIIDPTNAAWVMDDEVLAVRIWLRVRAERAENGFTDTTNYVYADQNVLPFNDGFRRVLVSKTIYLRNARPPQ